MQDLALKFQDLLMLHGLNLIAAIVILVVGRWLAKFISKMLSC